MDRIKGLKEYVQLPEYKKTLGIPEAAEEMTYYPLAQGEYNINYWFVHPVTEKKLVLRVNTGSQMHLEHQIEYEYNALKILENCGRSAAGLPGTEKMAEGMQIVTKSLDSPKQPILK